MSCNKDVELSLKHLKNLSQQVSDMIEQDNYDEVKRVLLLKDFVIETLINQHNNNQENYTDELIDLFENVKDMEKNNISVIKRKYEEIKNEKNIIDKKRNLKMMYGEIDNQIGSMLDLSE